MKKLLSVLFVVLLLAGCSNTAPNDCVQKSDADLMAEGWSKTTELPAARDTSKMYTPSKDAAEEACGVDTFAAACSGVSVENLTEYLGREDVVYIDLRDYSDYAKKHLKGFESIPFFGAIYNKDAATNPELVQLYGGNNADGFVSVYKESDDLLEAFFPKDKTIFLMCQSGGRVVTMMQILAAKGYDMSKVYNVGGMGQYTSGSYNQYTTNTEELTVTATYNFEGLTRN